MGVRFNPPPGWPPPPEGWRPTPTWVPEPAWPAPPPGWEFWVVDDPAPEPDPIAQDSIASPTTPPVSGRAPAPERPGPDDVPRPRWLVAAGVATVLGVGILMAAFVMRDQAQTLPGGSAAVTLPSVPSPSSPSPDPSPSPDLGPSPAPSTAGADSSTRSSTGGPLTALEALGTLDDRSSPPATRYSRAAYGQGWADPDGNGCDTGNDVLRRDLTKVGTKPGTRGCVVTAGRLLDPYAGRSIDFRPGTRSVAVDFVVPLVDAWVGGASDWTAAQRTQFLNDPMNLLAVQTTSAQKKRSRDAAGWLPSAVSYRCTYVARQIGVKATYGISVSAAERAAMRRVLAGCPDQALPADVRLAASARAGNTGQPAAAAPARPLIGVAPGTSG